MTDAADRDPAPAQDRLLSWPKVRDLTGLSRTTAWRLQRSGDFPCPVVISPGRVGWRESELAAWNASRRSRRALSEPVAAPGAAPGTTPDPRPARERHSRPPTSAAPARPRTRADTRRGRPRPPDPQITFNF